MGHIGKGCGSHVLFRLFCLLSIITAGHPAAWGQSAAGNPAVIQHYAAAERIPNSITDFVFDARGLLWITPENDNVRLFDGTNVRVLEAPFARGIPQFEFSRVLKDRTGNPCFVSRYQDYLFRLNAAGQLSEDSLLGARQPHIYNNGVFFFDWKDFIAAATNSGEREVRKTLEKRLVENKTFASFNDSTFAFKEADSLFIYSHGHLRRINTTGANVSNIFLLSDRLFLLGAGGPGLIDEQTASPQPVQWTGDLLDDSLFRAASPPPLKLFRSTYPHLRCGARLYRIQLGAHDSLSTVLVADIGFIHSSISKVAFEPLDEVTAIATKGEGLYILRTNPFYSRRFDDKFLALKRQQIFFPLTLQRPDTFVTPWCKFTGQGYYRLLDLTHPGSRALLADNAGTIWEGINNRVIRYDRNMVKQSDVSIPLPDTHVVDFCEAPSGPLLCLTDRSILQYANGNFVDKHPAMDRLPDGSRFEQIRSIGKGIFWLSANKGIYCYDLQANSLKRVEGFPDVFTLNIVKLSGGSILVTCYPESFYYLFYKDKFFRIPVEMDLPLKETSSLIEDGKGRIWFATTNGFFVTTEKEIESWCDGQTDAVYYYKYGHNEGLQDLELNGGLNESNGLSDNGYLVFNSMGGVTVFHQDSVRELFPSNFIQVARDGKAGEEFTAGDSIQLAHDNEGTVMQIRVPYFGSRDNLRIEYSMEPVTSRWKEVDQQGRINLEHLVPGVYSLSIRVRTGLRPGDYRTRRVSIIVPYFFYETPVFRLIAGVILLLIGLLLTVSIVRLRKEVRSKNIRLHEQNLQLQSTLGDLQENMELKEKLISLVLHDLKTPLYFQTLLLNDIVEEEYFKTKEAFRLFHDLKNSSTAILQFTKEFLAWYSSQREGFQVKNTEFDHSLVVTDLFSVYADIASRKNLELLYTSENIDKLITDRNILEIIIRNLLDNAIKYTEQGRVAIRFEKQKDAGVIVVSDTGKGMTAEKIKQLEQSTFVTRERSSPTFGYRFIYTMAEKIGATIRIASLAGKGTSVTIVIPQPGPVKVVP
jgi:signal transduction histidine kinase